MSDLPGYGVAYSSDSFPAMAELADTQARTVSIPLAVAYVVAMIGWGLSVFGSHRPSQSTHQPTDMSNPRSRRIVRRAVMAVVIPVLLVVWYVAAWLVWPHVKANRTIPVPGIDPVFAPMWVYCESGLPGSETLLRWYDDMNSDLIWETLLDFDFLDFEGLEGEE
jgi:hypothetical protein